MAVAHVKAKDPKDKEKEKEKERERERQVERERAAAQAAKQQLAAQQGIKCARPLSLYSSVFNCRFSRKCTKLEVSQSLAMFIRAKAVIPASGVQAA